jgi:hypothetical protein
VSTLLVVICQPGVCCCWTEQFNSFMKCHNSLLLHLATPPKTRDYIVPCCMLLLQHCYLVSFLLLHEHDQPWGWCPFVTCPFISWNWKDIIVNKKLKCCNHCTSGIHIGTQLITLGYIQPNIKQLHPS